MKSFDDHYRKEFNTNHLAGTDEAGRGPLAGPVVAAAVILPPDINLPGVNDSKQLTDRKRRELIDMIYSRAIAVNHVIIEPAEIDRINILRASLKAMKFSVEALNSVPGVILVDGNKRFDTLIPLFPIVKGDSKSLSIAAASIVAKVVRDDIMLQLASEYPGYGWDHNKGYPTKSHIKALQELGPTPYHRLTFIDHLISPGLFDDLSH
ncbi:MAG: ribonuclease HII [Ignavibacteriales bacterium]|nr:ribonuclease HII [Ignavibacteriales bacterium]